MKPRGTIEYCPFVTDEAVHCLWDWNVRKRNLDFLDSVDPGYVAFLARSNAAHLESDDKQYAAVALRVAYGQALETFFALVGALVQSPECVVGWLLRYKPIELQSLVTKIHNGKAFMACVRTRPFNWRTLSEAVGACYRTRSPEYDLTLVERYADFFHFLASDFLDKQRQYEYNSAKHGLRLAIGGSFLGIIKDSARPEKLTPDNVITLLSSDHGSSFLVAEKLTDARNFAVSRHAVNWDPVSLVARLELMSIAMANTLSFLKVLNGVDVHTLKFTWPSTIEVFESTYGSSSSTGSSTHHSTVAKAAITPLSAEQIRASYGGKGLK